LKKVIFIGLVFFLPWLAFANRGADKGFSIETNLKAFLSTDHYSAYSIKSFESFLRKLDKKNASAKSERAFVRYVFEKTHQRFLKNYEAYASLNETFDNGSYNCLTGTILFSLILHHYNIDHQVIETNYHIFIMAETAEGKILLEATDPLNGFVSSAKGIEERISLYKQNHELRGLTYYNNAVNSFNHKNLEVAVQNLVKANESYFSYRIEEFSQILLLSLQQSDLDLKTKENCMNTILSLRQKSLPVILASN